MVGMSKKDAVGLSARGYGGFRPCSSRQGLSRSRFHLYSEQPSEEWRQSHGFFPPGPAQSLRGPWRTSNFQSTPADGSRVRRTQARGFLAHMHDRKYR